MMVNGIHISVVAVVVCCYNVVAAVAIVVGVPMFGGPMMKTTHAYGIHLRSSLSYMFITILRHTKMTQDTLDNTM